MKYLLALLFNVMLAQTWQKNPVIYQNGQVSLSCSQTSCSTISNWLASSSQTNLIQAYNQQKIDLNWQHLPIKLAWQQLHKLCEIRTLKAYKAPVKSVIATNLQASLSKPSRLITEPGRWLLYGTDLEQEELKLLLMPKPKPKKPMIAIELKWLIMDEWAQSQLGLNQQNWTIEPINLKPSNKLWQIVEQMHNWDLILNQILQDLTQKRHMLCIAKPYLLTNLDTKSSLQTNILVPYIVKTAHASYNTMQNLPIDITVTCTQINDNLINLKLSSHMQQKWHQNNNWPIAVHALDTNINLKLNTHAIIAKQQLVQVFDASKNHAFFGFLRDNQQKSQHTLNLYVIANLKKAPSSLSNN